MKKPKSRHPELVLIWIRCMHCKRYVGSIDAEPDLPGRRFAVVKYTEEPLPIDLERKQAGEAVPRRLTGAHRTIVNSLAGSAPFRSLRCVRCGPLSPPERVSDSLRAAELKGEAVEVHAAPSSVK